MKKLIILATCVMFLAIQNINFIAEGTKTNFTITGTVPNAQLFAIIPNGQSMLDNDVCIYVTSDGSDVYANLVNKERATWGLDPVGVDSDLNVGSMLRAGENAELYLSGQRKEQLSHDSLEYEIVQENLLVAGDGSDASKAFKGYMTEKKYIPSNYNPSVNNNVDGAGHYTNMMDPTVKYVGQGMAYADYECDGGVGGYYSITYANEFEDYPIGSNLRHTFPDLQGEIDKNLAPFNITYGSAPTTQATTNNTSSNSNNNASNQTNQTSTINSTNTISENSNTEKTSEESSQKEKEKEKKRIKRKKKKLKRKKRLKKKEKLKKKQLQNLKRQLWHELKVLIL